MKQIFVPDLVFIIPPLLTISVCPDITDYYVPSFHSTNETLLWNQDNLAVLINLSVHLIA